MVCNDPVTAYRGQVLKPPTKGNFVYNFYQSWFGKPETAQEACGKLDFELEMVSDRLPKSPSAVLSWL